MAIEVPIRLSRDRLGLVEIEQRLSQLQGGKTDIRSLFRGTETWTAFAMVLICSLIDAGVVIWEPDMSLFVNCPDPEGIRFVVEGERG